MCRGEKRSDSTGAVHYSHIFKATAFAIIGSKLGTMFWDGRKGKQPSSAGSTLCFLTIRRLSLPRGDLDIPFLGIMPQYMSGPIEFLSPYLQQDWFLVHFFFRPQLFATKDSEHQWIWAQERKGLVRGFWPDHWCELMGGNVIATSYGSPHKLLRKLMEPAFLPAAVKSYTNILDTTIAHVLSGYAAAGKYQSTEVLRMFALRLLFVAVFQQDNEDRIAQLDADIDTWFKGFESLFPYNIPGTVFGNAKAARARIIETVTSLVIEFEGLLSADPTMKDTLLGRLLATTNTELGVPLLSREDLYSNLLVLFFAGHDTTYATSSNLLDNIVQYPEIAEHVRKEVSTLPQPPTWDSLKPSEAPLLNAFLDETMRLDPVIGISSKRPLVPLERHGYKIPKDFVISASLVASSQQCPYPGKFSLERFLPPTHPYVVDGGAEFLQIRGGSNEFRAFGGGQHVCLGQNFAKLELNLVLVHLLRDYDIVTRNREHVKFPLVYKKSEFLLTPKTKATV